ncbi:MAG: GIY-YIG nuclease family protein [Pseudomonadota bacterium]
MTNTYFVYLLASRMHGTLYCGVTNDLRKRVWQHRSGEWTGFTERYGVHRLVWYETHGDISAAIVREKRIKRWRRVWKLRLIEDINPNWNDLYPALLGLTPKTLSSRTPQAIRDP